MLVGNSLCTTKLPGSECIKVLWHIMLNTLTAGLRIYCNWKSGKDQWYFGWLTNRTAPLLIALKSCSNLQQTLASLGLQWKKFFGFRFRFCCEVISKLRSLWLSHFICQLTCSLRKGNDVLTSLCILSWRLKSWFLAKLPSNVIFCQAWWWLAIFFLLGHSITDTKKGWADTHKH